MDCIDHYKNSDSSIYKTAFEYYDIRKTKNNSGNCSRCNSNEMQKPRCPDFIRAVKYAVTKEITTPITETKVAIAIELQRYLPAFKLKVLTIFLNVNVKFSG